MTTKFTVLRQHFGDKLYNEGDERDARESDVAHLVKSGVLQSADKKSEPAPKNKAERGAPLNKDGLREDGPTVTEYVSAGYSASAYPPSGYASRSTEDEISAAVADERAKAEAEANADADAAKAELEKLTNKQLHELAAAETIAVESDDNKASLIGKIIAGRAAKD